MTDWGRCIEHSHYFSYGKELGKYKAATANKAIPTEKSYHQKLISQTQIKIEKAIALLKQTSTWPRAITKRFQALVEQGIGKSTLYRYKSLWPPNFEPQSEKPNPVLGECQPACPQGTAGLALTQGYYPKVWE